MRHSDRNKKFGRTAGPRRALLRNLAESLILREKIMTTEARAKSLRPLIERLVTHGKRNTLASRRLVTSRLGTTSDAAKKLMDVIAPRYTERSGGYTRIVKVAPKSSGDARRNAYIEFV